MKFYCELSFSRYIVLTFLFIIYLIGKIQNLAGSCKSRGKFVSLYSNVEGGAKLILDHYFGGGSN